MKKLLFSMALLLAGSVMQAQRLSIYEEFSGENCDQCAQSSPGLNQLIGNNAGKVVLVRYLTATPTGGPLYFQNAAEVEARRTYYGITTAPAGRLNGTGLGTGTQGTPGFVGNLLQGDIDNAYLPAPVFNVTATHTWTNNGATMNATVNVTSTGIFNTPGANMKLRAALVEHLEFANPPGLSIETDFPNVMRKMYPDAAGTSIPNAWSANQSQSFTLTGPVPNYIDKSAEVFLVVWLQNDADKSIVAVTASSPIAIAADAGTPEAFFDNALLCTTGTINATPTVTLKNAGTDTLKSATIYYKLDNGPYSSFAWTGVINPGGTANVIMPAIAVTPGRHIYKDSVAMPNGQTDINAGNATSTAIVDVHNNTGVNLPINSGFESALIPAPLPSGWLLHDADGDGYNWVLASSTTGNIGHNGSKYYLAHNNFSIPGSDVNYAILPHPNLVAGPKALDFWQAHAVYPGYTDELEVVYSTDCGDNWTTVWSRSGAGLATAPDTNRSYIPTQAQWAPRSVDMTNVPNGAMVAFRATSGFGNNLYIDDVAFRTGEPNGLENAAVVNDHVAVYPNPARESVSIAFIVAQGGNVSVSVIDATGRVVGQPANGRMEAGAQQLSFNTAALSAGIYHIRIQTANGVAVRRLSVIR